MQDLPRHNTRRGRENNNNNNPPSFSSTLLDAIYRSIDESNDKVHHNDNDNMIFYREAKGMKACMIEKWIDEEEHTYEKKVSIGRKSMADLSSSRNNNNRNNNIQPVLLNSSSSSSESSCCGGFSSSESSESVIIQRPKPIRTSVNSVHQSEKHRNCAPDHIGKELKKDEYTSGFVKTKSKALKIYGDLKKVKQPISPGGRLATFLNSIFTAGNNTKNNAKKAKISSVYDDERKFKSEQTSTCSSASSFSRSCLSKTPSSRGNNNGSGAKRSVRFYPVSVIVGEDSRPCGQKNVYESHQLSTATLRNSNSNSKTKSKSNSMINEELKFRVMNESRRVEEVARDLLKNYQKKQQQHEEEEEDDDDGASCASSDLFELDNLSAIGIERYREELPVYETTYLSTTNRAIANGLFM